MYPPDGGHTHPPGRATQMAPRTMLPVGYQQTPGYWYDN
jgi:hypothetical protein